MFVNSGTMSDSKKSEGDSQTAGGSSSSVTVREEELVNTGDQVRHAICVNNNLQPFWVDQITYSSSL